MLNLGIAIYLLGVLGTPVLMKLGIIGYIRTPLIFISALIGITLITRSK